MARKRSMIAPDWWDYTTVDDGILADAAKLTPKDLSQLSRDGFKVVIYDDIKDFYVAEALEYVEAWKQSTADNPAGICGPIGPTEQLPLVALIVNAMEISLKNAHFWGMDEWVVNGKAVPPTHPLSFVKADNDLCFDRIKRGLKMPKENMHFPSDVNIKEYSASYDRVRCVVMQGGQGDVKHWAFNDPLKREGQYKDNPPSPAEYRKLGTRMVDLHPLTITQNARTSNGGYVTGVPVQAMTVGPLETWKAEKVSIWHPGYHDNAFGIRLSALMISKKIPDAAVPMSLLADHPNVQFNYCRPNIGSVEVDMH
jgi:glucosamine-6-phosphate deaminase